MSSTFKERANNAKKASGVEARRLQKLRAAPPVIDWDKAITRWRDMLDEIYEDHAHAR